MRRHARSRWRRFDVTGATASRDYKRVWLDEWTPVQPVSPILLMPSHTYLVKTPPSVVPIMHNLGTCHRYFYGLLNLFLGTASIIIFLRVIFYFNINELKKESIENLYYVRKESLKSTDAWCKICKFIIWRIILLIRILWSEFVEKILWLKKWLKTFLFLKKNRYFI